MAHCPEFATLRYVALQIFSSDAVNVGVGVYWMFYTGGCYEPAVSPAGLPGFPERQEIEGLRSGPQSPLAQKKSRSFA